MAYLKPQSPIQLNDNYIYPLTTADQVITSTGERLNSLFKKTIRESATLRAANWSETLPHTQTITLRESTDDYNVDANVAYGNGDNAALNKAAGCISYIKKNHKDITFYCLKNKPEVDIPVEITGTCRNTIATVEEGVKLNFDIKRYNTEEELLADTPMENTIGIISDVEINGYRFSAIEPESMNEGEIWIKNGTESNTVFNVVDGIIISPVSAKQYVNGTPVLKIAYLQQNGEWIQFSWKELYLYRNGDQCVSLTGGWEKKDYVSGSGMTVTFESSRIKLYSSSSASSIVIGCKNIEPSILKNFKTMYVSGTRSSGEFGFGIAYDYDIEDLDNTSDIIVYKKAASSGTYSVDITDIDSGYPVLHAYHGTSYITKIWLE